MEAARQDLPRRPNQAASVGTRAGVQYISGDESDTESSRHCRILVLNNPILGQPVFLWAIGDTAGDLNIISYPKACLIAPEGISDDFAHLESQSLDTVGGEITVHGPMSLEFRLGGEDNHMRYSAPFYVVPRRYGEMNFDALLNSKLSQRLGLV